MQSQHLVPGRVVRDRYRVTGKVGQGAVGFVYRACDLIDEQHVALKHLVATTPREQVAFEREAAILSSLAHPWLPTASDYFVESGRPLLVMKLVPGPDLGQLLAARAEPFDLSSVLRWADDLLDALIYLHARGSSITTSSPTTSSSTPTDMPFWWTSDSRKRRPQCAKAVRMATAPHIRHRNRSSAS